MVYNPSAGDKLSSSTDTIAAIATPAGIGGIGIVRVSGCRSCEFARILTGAELAPRKVMYREFLDDRGRLIDQGVLLYFPAPESYTGEDVCEFQCHGSPVVLNLLLSRLLALGARLAEPGEYTRRAFLNDKLDLAQAEAVVDLINSSTTAAAQSAMRSLSGEFSDRIHQIVDKLVDVRIFVEAAIDFPDEEIDFLADPEILRLIEDIQNQLAILMDQTSTGCILREGITVAIVGRPNAGKSSLFNRLAQQERAIVTPQAGTTRDTIDVVIDVTGLAVRLIDTAGIRQVSDSIEHEGIARARVAVRNADMALYVIDSEQGIDREDIQEIESMDASRTVILWNKTDLTGDFEFPLSTQKYQQAHVSALLGTGIEQIYKIIQQVSGYEVTEEGVFLARRRHFGAIQSAAEFVDQARNALTNQLAGELAAQDLRDAMEALDLITGTPSADELLGEIFANFCIGK